jgi:predicted ATPase
VRQLRQLGAQGQYTAHFLSLFGNEDIPVAELQHPRAMSLSLRNQVEAWLSDISPGARLNLTSVPEMDIVGLRYSFTFGRNETNPYRTTNVGFGLTYTLPILVAVLSSKPGALILLENPEAHLHPKGQALMGELFARAAAAGIQMVVESHSDHVLNGIRVAVRQERVAPEKVTIHFFGRDENTGEHMLISPQIDQDGRISEWPEHFFDEYEKSLEALLMPRSDEDDEF